MADASAYNNIRTLEELIGLVSKIAFNTDSMSKIYYDLFINPTPMDIELERYDDTGKLVKVPVPNRAKDMATSYSGSGSPNGQQAARVGSLYVDNDTLNLYYKSTGTDASGWLLVWTPSNFVAGTNYLAPTGSGEFLTNLNAGSISSGTLGVSRGGTGVSVLTGIVKANGTSPYTAAADGVDYLGPNSMTGIICYYPVNLRADNGLSAIPTGWVRCDGGAYSRTTYSRLFNIIGTVYGGGDGSTTFNVPNLYNHFVRCWDGTSAFNTVQQDNVGKHRHDGSPLVVGSESAHTHTRGTMNITGSVVQGSGDDEGACPGHVVGSGAFSVSSSGGNGASGNSNYGGYNFDFQASRAWTGATSEGSPHTHTISGFTEYVNGGQGEVTETRVLNKMLVPIIKY